MATKTKTTKTRKVSGANARDVTIANALGDAEYGPQVSAVQDLFRQAKQQYASDVDAAKANAAATISAVRSARQPTRDIYAEATRSAANTAKDIDASVATRIGQANPVSNLLSASVARERGTQANRVSGEQAGALNELQQQTVGAAAGRQLGISQARSEFGTTRGTLSQKLEDIMGARGAKVAAQMGQLANTRETRTSRESTAAADRASREKIAADRLAASGKKTGKGPGWLPKGQAAKGLSQLASLKSYADKAKAGAAFVAGHAGQPKLGRYEAEKKINDNVAAPQHPMLLRAALDAAYDGHISAYTVKGLIQAGYQPSEVARALGTKTSGEFKKAQQASSRALTGANAKAYGNQGNLGQSGHK